MGNSVVDEDGCTIREANFAHHWVLHGKNSAAYRYAFDATNMNGNTISNKAHKILNSPQVQYKIKRIQAERDREFDLAVHDIKKVLAKVASEGLKMKLDRLGNQIPVDLKAAVSSMAEFNRMNGNHAPVESRVTGADGGPVVVKSLSDFYADSAPSEQTES